MKCCNFIFYKVFFLLWILPLHLALCQGLKLNGKVIDDQTREPLIGAHIMVQDKWSIGTMTGVEGTFNLEDLKITASDSILVSFIGYQDKTFSVKELMGGQTIIELSEQARAMSEVMISAEKLIAEEFSVQKVEKLDIYMNPNAKADPLLAVNSIAAATTTDESANISLRGSSPAETGIFFDNVPIYDAVRFSQLNGIGTFSIFNTAIVDNVQIFPGNPPLEYGNTTAGLIAIQSDETIPGQNVNSAVVSLASLGYSTKAKLGSKSVFNVFTNLGLSSGLTALNSQSLKDLKKFNSWDVGLHFSGEITTELKFKIFNYSLLESYEYAFRSPSFEGTFLQRKKRNFTVANLRYRFGLSELTVNQGLSFSKSNFEYSLTDIELRNDDFYTSVNYQYLGVNLNIKTGLTLDRRTQDFDGAFPQFDFAQGPEHPFISGQANTTVNVPEWYVYSKYYLNDQWTAGFGLRRNIAQDNRADYWSSQVNISFAPNESLDWHLSAGKYHKEGIGQDETGNSLGQIIQSKQISLDQNFKTSKIEQHFAVFAKSTKFVNTKNTTYGAEFFLSYRINRRLSASASYTYINGSIEEREDSYASPYDLNYFIKGNLQYKLPNNWTVAATFLFRQGQFHRTLLGSNYRSDLDVFEPFYAPRTDLGRLPAYRIVDMNITKLFPISENFTMVAFASASNVFNFKNTSSYRFNEDYSLRSPNLFSQRTLYCGVILNF